MEIQDFLLKIVNAGKEFFEAMEKVIQGQELEKKESAVEVTTHTPDAIRDLSKRVGSQMELAKHLGVSPGTVNRWISGRSKPRHQYLVKMAELNNKYPSVKSGPKPKKVTVKKVSATKPHPIAPEYIKKLARGVGSQRRLADMLKVHHVSVNKWVKGLSNPRVKLLPKLKEIEEHIEKGIIVPVRKSPKKTGIKKTAKKGKPKPTAKKKSVRRTKSAGTAMKNISQSPKPEVKE